MATPIQDFYKDQSVFITGATGFIGKVLMEKLLYSTDVKKIYILIRPKRGKLVKLRMSEMFELPLFERLRKEKPDVWKKVVPLEGDVLSEDLGLEKPTVDMLANEVNIIFNSAATLKLEANLKDSIKMNTLGTWRLIKIARLMKKLKVFVHLSTAFCYPDYEVLDEKVHDSTENPHDVMQMIEWMPDEGMAAVEANLLGKHPNTYTYTKRLAETLIRNEYPKLPVCIARPSIVIPTWNEPIPGWVDTLNGPMGVMVGAGKGVIRTMHCDSETKAEIVPVDFLTNSLIVYSHHVSTAKEKPSEIPVANLCCGDSRDTTWGFVLNLGRETIKDYPLNYPVWYPGGNLHKNKFVHKINEFLFHFIPAYFIDFLMLLFRQKRFMVRLQNRISLGLNLLEFFTMRQWIFHNNVYKELCRKLTPKEEKIFSLDHSVIVEKEYIKRCIIGGKQYCLKESLKDLPKQRVVFKIMFVLDRLIKFLFYGYIIWIIYHFSVVYLNSWQSLPAIKNIRA